MVLKRKEKKTGGGGNNEYRCRYCGLKITGGPAKIRGHFLDGVEGGQRVKKCTAPSDPNIPGNNFEAVNFVCNKRRACEGTTSKQYRKRAKTCGLPQEKLDLHNWIDDEQRCTARKKDGSVCGCFYSAHSTVPRISTISDAHNSVHQMTTGYVILPSHELLQSTLECSGDDNNSLHASAKIVYDEDIGDFTSHHPSSSSAADVSMSLII
eukprot:gene25421-33969_t